MAEEEATTPTPETPDLSVRELALLRWSWRAFAVSLVLAVAAILLMAANDAPLVLAPAAPEGSREAAPIVEAPPEEPAEEPSAPDDPSRPLASDDEDEEPADEELARRAALAAAGRILEAGRVAGQSGPLACLAQEGLVLQTWPVCACLAEAVLAGQEEPIATAPYERNLRATPRGIVDWELAFSGARAAHILRSWRAALAPADLGEVLRHSLVLDRLLIGAYVLGLTALCLLGLCAFPQGKRSLWIAVCCLPLTAGVMDMVENQALARQLDLFAQTTFEELTPRVLDAPANRQRDGQLEESLAIPAENAGVAASLKFALLGITALALLLVGLAWLGKCLAKPRTAVRVDTATVLTAEKAYLRRRRDLAKLDRDDDIGLALSGGGLRSATINLGVLQALAREKVLPHFDYLSTVSGGGYIGSALSSLLSINAKRIRSADDESPRQFQFGPGDEPWFSAQPDRFPFNPNNEDDLEGRGGFGGLTQMRHLRASGKFLIPKSNPLSIEMLRVIGGVLAGIFYHLVHFGFLMISISAGYLATIYWMVGGWATRNPPQAAPVAAEAPADPALLAQYTRFVKDAFGANMTWDWSHPLVVAMVAGLATMAVILFLWKALLEKIEPAWFHRPGDTEDGNRNQTMVLAMIVAMLLLGFGVLVTWFSIGDQDALLNICIPLFSYLGGGVALACAHGWVKIRTRFRRRHRSRLAAQEGAFITLTVVSLILVLLVMPFLIFFDSVADYLENRPVRSLFGWLLTLLGARAFAGDEDGKGAKGMIARAVDFVPGLRKVLLSVLVVLAVLGAALLICVLIWRHEPMGWHFQARLAIAVLAMAAFVGTGWLNFNRLALHTFYRDRLAEAFLRTTTADPDSGDMLVPRREGEYILLQDLHGREPNDQAACVTAAPYQLLVTCLNLTGASVFERQATRRTDQFIFSKLYCGSEVTGYQKTAQYRGGDTRLSHAMTISGAAASPAMGNLSFFGQSMAMTLFNVRLGQWMENPSWTGGTGKKQTFWPVYLLKEILASSDADERLVYLSDGGHSGDNLGIYPLLKRRCKLIVAVDAEYDPECSCNSLVEALRQISIDERTEVRIDLRRLRPDPETGISATHYATGEIDYPDGSRGTLIVVKSSLTGDEPEIVANYDRANEEFPHQTTGDLFFDDAQFEAYRRLGGHMIRTVLRKSRASRSHLTPAP